MFECITAFFRKKKGDKTEYNKVSIAVAIALALLTLVVSVLLALLAQPSITLNQSGQGNIQQINTNSNVTTIVNQFNETKCTGIFNQVYEEKNDLTEQLKACQNGLQKNETVDECLNDFHFPLNETRGARITGCDIPLHGDLSGVANGLTVDLVIIPYNSDRNTRYIFDAGNGLETDRISVFLENGFLKVQTKSNNFEEGMLKVPITEVQMRPNGQYGITTRISNDSITLFVFDYSKIGAERFVAKKTILTNNSLDLTGSSLVIGGDLQLKNQFDGVFDEVRISNVVRSDDWIIATHCQTYSIGPEETLNASN